MTHFDPEKELLLECDVPPHGVGAVLFHRVGRECRPNGFRSRSLTPARTAFPSTYSFPL